MISALILTCVFTEPFFSVVVDESARRVTVDASYDEPSPPATFPFKTFTVNGGETLLTYGQNRVLAYRHDGRGSDGMSGRVYPWSAEDRSGGFRPLHGGCFSAEEPPLGE